MKTSGLGICFQPFSGNAVDYDGVALGFDAMLGHDVVKFLTTNHSIKPKAVDAHKQNVIWGLDEHELAMV